MNRKKYQKPAIKTEKMFEKTVLECVKCPGMGNQTGKCDSDKFS
ncbi:MAG TPA: hypothetical protein PL168_03700 [Methanobacterium sp.]|jgi:hypothetical protein|nr:hypothetical protein [Methanobacterium sp.]